MHQCEINALASKHGLEPSKQHRGSDNRGRFFLTQDLAGGERGYGFRGAQDKQRVNPDAGYFWNFCDRVGNCSELHRSS